MKAPITIVLLALSAIISPTIARSQDTTGAHSPDTTGARSPDTTRSHSQDPTRSHSSDSTRSHSSDSAKSHAKGDAPNGDKAYTKVEIESSFPGGSSAWLQFLQQHLVYPNKAVRKKIEGSVMLQFIVDKDGTVYDLQALTGDPLLQEAALKAMANSPRWIPAIQDGRKVKSYKKQPIVFRLQ